MADFIYTRVPGVDAGNRFPPEVRTVIKSDMATALTQAVTDTVAALPGVAAAAATQATSVAADAAVGALVPAAGALPGGGSSAFSQKADGRYVVRMPDPSGGDDTAMFTAYANWSQTTGGEIALGYGTYRITGYSGSADFPQARMRGHGRVHTKLKCTSSTNGATFLKFNGGSGHPSDGGLTDVAFETSDTATGIVLLELAGVCFFDFSRTYFDGTPSRLAGEGVRFHNQTSGQFTEMNVGHDVIFGDYLATAYHYKVTSGSDSFHGSGVDGNTTIGQPDPATFPNPGPRIVIDAAARPYSAPLTAKFFMRDAGQPIIQNFSGLAPHFYGAVQVESFASAPVALATIDGSRPPVYLSGTFDRAGDVNLGSLYLCEQFSHAGTNVGMQLKPRSFRMTGVDARTTPADVCYFELLTQGFNVVAVQVIAAGYQYAYLLGVYIDPYDGTSGTGVTVLSTGRTSNSTGYAPPTFAVDSGHLHMICANPSVEIRAHVTPGFGFTV